MKSANAIIRFVAVAFATDSQFARKGEIAREGEMACEGAGELSRSSCAVLAI